MITVVVGQNERNVQLTPEASNEWNPGYNPRVRVFILSPNSIKVDYLLPDPGVGRAIARVKISATGFRWDTYPNYTQWELGNSGFFTAPVGWNTRTLALSGGTVNDMYIVTVYWVVYDVASSIEVAWLQDINEISVVS